MSPEDLAVPAELRHLLPLNHEMKFLLSVLSLLGTCSDHVVYTDNFEVLSLQNPDDMKPYPKGALLKKVYPALNAGRILQPIEHHVDREICSLRFDRFRFLRCLTMEEKMKAFRATTIMLRKLFPEQNGEDTMYDDWLLCERYVAQVCTLAKHWERLAVVHEMLEAPLEFVVLLRHCAGYLRDANELWKARALTNYGLGILARQDFSSQASSQTLDLLKAHFLSIRGFVVMQLVDYAAASKDLTACCNIRHQYYPKENRLDSLASGLHMASLCAAKGDYANSIKMCEHILKIRDHPLLENTYGRHLLMSAATLTARVQIIKRQFSEAEQNLSYASSLYDISNDNPIFKRAYDCEFGNLRFAKGDIEIASENFENCLHDSVKFFKDIDGERTISCHYKIAIIGVQKGEPKLAMYMIGFALSMCNSSSLPCYTAWKGRFYLLWARIPKKFPKFADEARADRYFIEDHEEQVEKLSTALGISSDSSGVVTDEQFSSYITWNVR